MIQRIGHHLLGIIKKYNELVVWHVIFLPMMLVVVILVYWLFEDARAVPLFLIFASLLVLPERYRVNRARTCPSCKTWIYSDASSFSGGNRKYRCKRCEGEWG